MSWQYTPYAIPLIVAGAVSLAVAAIVWRRRSTSGAWPMLLLMVSGAVWAFGNAMELGSRELGDKILWANVEYLGIVLIPVFWLVFAEQYTDVGRTLRYRDLLPLLILPLVTLVLVWTDPLHGLMRRSVRLDASGPVSLVAKEYGPWFWVHTAYSYLLLAVGTVLLVRVLFRSSHIYRGQAGALITAVLLPWLANGLYLAEPELTVRLDLTPVAFVCSGTICSWALLRYGLLDLVPAARQATLQGMADGLLVLDAQRRLVDMNPAAERIVRVTLADALGRTIDEVAPDDLMPDLADAPAEAEALRTVDGQERWFDALASPLVDGRGMLTGWVLVLRDTTERKRAEAERERLLDEVQRRAAELDATIASMAEAVAIHGPGGEIVRANPSAEEMMGLVVNGHRLATPDLLSRVSFLQPDGQPFTPSQYPAARALRGETVRGALAVLRDARGEEHWLSESAAPIRDVEGRVLGAVVTATDITERRRIEQELLRARESLERRVAERTAALRHTNEALQAEIAERERVRQALAMEHQAVDRQRRRLRAVLDILPVGVAIVERNGRVAEANAAAAAVWGG
ncbi:MAG: PAS domain-containing protein, partial [Chloroflexi bacterium]|nr:PAS domain-containing protein [Chloroflexota bacterium]